MKKEASNPNPDTLSLAEQLDRALSYHRRGQLDLAEAAYSSVLVDIPNQPDALHFLGVLAQQRGNSAKAEQLIRAAITQHALPVMWSNLAAVLTSQGKHAEALFCRHKAWQLAPEDIEQGFNLACEYLLSSQWSEAQKLLEHLVDKKPNWSAALLNLANCYKNQAKRDKAEMLYLQVLALDPELPELHSNLGAFYSENDRGEVALEHHKKAVALMPQNALFHYNLGNGYWALGRWGEAATAYQNALALRPDLIQARMNFGTALLIAGDLNGALSQFKLAEQIDPAQSQIYTSMGYIASQLKRYNESEAFFWKAIRLQEDNIGAWSGLANVYISQGWVEKAREAVSKALEIEPSNGIAWLELAKIEERLNQPDKAAIALRNAMKKPANMGLYAAAADQTLEACLRLANLCTSLGQKRDALELFRQGVDELRETPGFSRHKRELPGKKIVLLRPVGRSGSLFLHSLIDAHPKVSTTPSILLKGYFGKTMWAGLQPIFSDDNWREVLVSRFVRIYAPLLDAANPQPIPGNPMGSTTHVGKATGLTSMGPSGKEVLRVDEKIFSARLIAKLRDVEAVSAPRFFEWVHEAWDAACGWPEDKPIIFYHIHNPDPMELTGCLAGFTDARLLNIVREPTQSVESWMRECLSGEKQSADALLYAYSESVDRLHEMLRTVTNIAHESYPSAVIRLEDVKRATEKTLTSLAAWLGVEDHPCLRHPTFGGLMYEAPAATPIKAFDTSNLDRKLGVLFSEYDQRVMNLLLYPIAVKYGYREASSTYLANEIAWYKSRVTEPLDFERTIQKELKALGCEQDINGPRRHFESIAQRCINLLEQFETYPAMAPLLRVV